MTLPPQDIDRSLWLDAALGVAVLDRRGVVQRANPRLERLAGRFLAGVPLIACIAPAQHVAFHAALAALGDGRRTLLLGLFPDAGDVPRDHQVTLRGEDSRVVAVVAPDVRGQEALVERLLRLNEDLLEARRSRHPRSEVAARLVRHTRSIIDPQLGSLPARQLVVATLLRLVESLDAAAAVVLERRRLQDGVALVVTHAYGDGVEAGRAPDGRSMAGRLAVPPTLHVVRDPLSLRLLSPALAGVGARSLALVPLFHDGRILGALHVAGRSADAFANDDLVLWAAAARIAPTLATGDAAPDGRPADPEPAPTAAAAAARAAHGATGVVVDRPGGHHVVRAVLPGVAGVPAEAAAAAGELAEVLLARGPFSPGPGERSVTVTAEPHAGGLRVTVTAADAAPPSGAALDAVRRLASAWGYERRDAARLWFEVQAGAGS